MIDVKGFCKLMDLNVPDIEHFDYYIEQLSKLERWKNIYHLISLYEEAENEIGNLYEFRLKKSEEVINFLRDTRAYNELNDDNLIPTYPTTKNFEYSEDRFHLSVDIISANWTVLKKYDPEFLNELGLTYSDLLKKFGFPEIFFYSKQLRQFIFGNLNPKKQCRAQRVIIQELIEKWQDSGLEIVCIKNDEVIWAFDNLEQIKPIVENLDLKQFKTKIFKVKRIDDFRLNTFYDLSGNFLYKEMSGCNGNLFFLNLKKWVLEEEIDIRDLFFRMDGRVAIWNEPELKVSF